MGDRAPEDTPGATQGLRAEPFRRSPHDRRPESAGHEDLERQEDPDAPFLQPPDRSERGVDLFFPDGEAPLSRETQGRPEGDAVSIPRRSVTPTEERDMLERALEDAVRNSHLHWAAHLRSAIARLERRGYCKQSHSRPAGKDGRSHKVSIDDTGPEKAPNGLAAATDT